MTSLLSLPLWLSQSQLTSHKAYIQHTLQEREQTRTAIRSLHLQRLNPPPDVRQLFDYYSIAVGCHPDNAKKNRYVDVKPYDRTRVGVADRNGTQQRYLNASWCLEKFGHKWWIASQAPLPSTTHAFLSLIRQPIALLSAQSPPLQPTRVRTVVQLTRLVEGSRRKAHPYFPSDVGQTVVHASETGIAREAIRVTLIESVDIAEACAVKSTVSISLLADPENSVTFQHLLYTAWPDQGVPELEDQKSLTAFIRLVDSTNRQLSDDPDPPCIVGCSAGIGRTGTFIAISSLLRAHGFLPNADMPSSLALSSPLDPLTPIFNEDLVAQEVDSLREQRPGMVQQTSQLDLIYTLLESAFTHSTLS
ncbi:protein-tyrosine phosphatase-like protein [Mycena crocata]|nr:protein-tyrosine phosphatase-like protein [Mycena crocata]